MLKDVLDFFGDVAQYEIISESNKRFKIKDHQDDGNIFVVKKTEWYDKILTWIVGETLMDRFIMDGLDFDGVKKLCLQVATLENAIKESD